MKKVIQNLLLISFMMIGQLYAQTLADGVKMMENENYTQAQNIFEPGSGEAALTEARRQREIASSRLEETAIESANVDVSRYVNQLPSAETIRRELESIPTIQLPPPPRFTREAN